MQHWQCLSCQRCERFVPVTASSSLIYHSWFLKHHHSVATHHHHRRCVARRSCHTHENCMHAKQIIIFYIYFFIFCIMCLIIFSVVLYRSMVTVSTVNIFPYKYLRQMHQIIIHLSLVGCFTPARGKRMQKYRELSGVNITTKIFFEMVVAKFEHTRATQV